MLPCQKRQIVVKNGETAFRCINRDCPVSGKTVTADACAVCTFRVPPAALPPCQKAKKGIKPEPEEKPKFKFEPKSFEVKPEDTPDGEGAKGYPPLSMQLFNYKQALQKWHEAGRPTRTDEQVSALLEICKGDGTRPPCDWYDPSMKRCKGCGCRVTEGGLAIFNKLRMATEECPKGLWK